MLFRSLSCYKRPVTFGQFLKTKSLYTPVYSLQTLCFIPPVSLHSGLETCQWDTSSCCAQTSGIFSIAPIISIAHISGRGGLHCCGAAGHCLRFSVLQESMNCSAAVFWLHVPVRRFLTPWACFWHWGVFFSSPLLKTFSLTLSV